MRQFWAWALSGALVVSLVAVLVLSSPLAANGLNINENAPKLSGRITSAPQVVLAGNDESPDEEDSFGFVPDEVVIKLFPGSDLAAVAADYRLNPIPLSQFGSRSIYRMQILDGASPLDRAEALQADLRVEFAEPNFIVQAPEWRSRYSWARFDEPGNGDSQWAGETLRLDEAHQVSTGEGVTVAVLDTGVEATHPDLEGRTVPGFDFVDLDNDPGEVGGYSDATPAYGHGTHVAGLIAFVAPDARIIPVRVLDPQGNGNIWVLAEAILYAVDPDGNPATPDGADVINLSLSTPRRTDLLEEIIQDVACYDDDFDDDDDGDDDSDDDFDDNDFDDDVDEEDIASTSNAITLSAATNGAGNAVTAMSYSSSYTVSRVDDDDDDDCDDGTGRGVVVTASAGNSGTDMPEYPAAEDVSGLLSVAASGTNDQLTSTSSFGPWVDIAAPGENIVSAMPEGQYASWSGTSMSSALAAGQMALIRAAYPDMTSADVVARIVMTSVTIPGPVPLRIDPAASVTAPR